MMAMRKSDNYRFMAMAVLALLVFSVCVVVVSDEGSDAAVGDGGTYSYTLNYDSSKMGNANNKTWDSTLPLSVSGMDPIYRPSYSNSTATGYGSWTWDTTTGRGPFNSFYAAFDRTNGNAIYAILNPFDLTKTISGETLSNMSNYNIMWVLPTVYWKTTSTSLTLTNDSTAGGTAYAHTIDGHVYNYIALGVYEAGTATVGGNTVLTSESGVIPAVSHTRAEFRQYAHNYSMSSTLNSSSSYPAYSMQWNFYQYEVYKYCGLILMENFNSQYVVGNGYYEGTNLTTGSLNASGPYSGSQSSDQYVKLFIENVWGGVWDTVDGIVIKNGEGVYIDTKSTPNDGKSGTYISKYTINFPASNNYASKIYTNNAQLWGYPNAITGSDNTGTADYQFIGGGDCKLSVGGDGGLWSGVSSLGLNLTYFFGLSNAGSGDGSRLAFVFDAGPTSNVTPATSNSDYGTVSSTTAIKVDTGASITVSGNTFTVKDYAGTNRTITATPSTSTAQYTYAFSGWNTASDGTGTTISSSYTVTSSAVTIYAMFTRTTNEYTVSFSMDPASGYGTISGNSISNVEYGSTMTVSDNAITLNGTTITATPATDTAQYDYGFDGWYYNNTKITSSLTVSGNMSIVAKFTRTVNDYTVSFDVDPSGSGTLSQNTLTVPYGTALTVSSNTITDGTTTITVTTTTDDPYYDYTFDGWYYNNTKITSSISITSTTAIVAKFNATQLIYDVNLVVDPSGFGTLSSNVIPGLLYGTTVTVSGNTITDGTTTVTATPITDSTGQYNYFFVGWTFNGSPVTDPITVTSNITVNATFDRTVRYYDATFSTDPASGYGTISANTIPNVAWGSTFTVNGSSITLNGTTITATPASVTQQWTYYFDGWYIDDEKISTGTIFTGEPITAVFKSELTEYTATVESNNEAWGTVSIGTIDDVPYDSVIHISGEHNEILTLNNVAVYATPNGADVYYTYGFGGYSVQDGDRITGDITITANFTSTARTYVVLFRSADTTMGTVDTAMIAALAGSTFTVNGNVISLSNLQSTATPKIDPHYIYGFTGWFDAITGGNPITNSTEVISDMDVYARFSATPKTFEVTFNPNGGTVVGDRTKTVTYGQPYGQLPTATKGDYLFTGWYTQSIGGTPITADSTVDLSANQTLYAHFMDSGFLVTFNPNGGTLIGESPKVVVYGDAYGELPSASREHYIFQGWFTMPAKGEQVTPDTIVNLTRNQTLYAHFTPQSYIVTFNATANGGVLPQGTPNTKVVYYNAKFGTLPTADKIRYDFSGWYTEQTGGTKITSNKTVTITEDTTLYAHYELAAVKEDSSGVPSFSEVTKEVSDSFFNGNSDVAGIAMFIVSILASLAITRNMFFVLLIGVGVTMLFTVLGILSTSISILLIVVSILGLAYTTKKEGRW